MNDNVDLDTLLKMMGDHAHRGLPNRFGAGFALTLAGIGCFMFRFGVVLHLFGGFWPSLFAVPALFVLPECFGISA